MRFLFMYVFVVTAIALFSSCSTPVTWSNKYNNLLTPDRLGIGVSNGMMSAHGVSNKFLPNQPMPMEMDMRGDTESTSIWLEWDFPQWRDNRDAERYLRHRVRLLEMSAEMLDGIEMQSEDEEPEKVH